LLIFWYLLSAGRSASFGKPKLYPSIVCHWFDLVRRSTKHNTGRYSARQFFPLFWHNRKIRLSIMEEFVGTVQYVSHINIWVSSTTWGYVWFL